MHFSLQPTFREQLAVAGMWVQCGRWFVSFVVVDFVVMSIMMHILDDSLYRLRFMYMSVPLVV